MRRIQERSRGNYEQRPYYRREDDRWYASGPRDDDRDRDDYDRERSSRWQDERYDEHRFNQDEDDRAGRSWGGMSGEYEIDDDGRFRREDEDDDERTRRGRYNTRSPNYDDRPRSFAPMRGMRGERDQFGRYTGDERFGGWQQQRRGTSWQDRPRDEPPRYRENRPYEARRHYEDDRYFQQRQARDDDRRFYDRRDVRDDYDRRRDFASYPDEDRRRGAWTRR